MPSSNTREAPCPRSSTTPYPLDALYRLANRKEVTHEAVLEPHRQRTLRVMRQAEGPVLVIHDTTELDYTSLSSLTGLGQIGNGSGRGYECHNTLAVHAPTRTVLGLANQILARRDTVGKGESRQARRDARDPREPALEAGQRGGRAGPRGGHVGRHLRSRC